MDHLDFDKTEQKNHPRHKHNPLLSWKSFTYKNKTSGTSIRRSSYGTQRMAEERVCVYFQKSVSSKTHVQDQLCKEESSEMSVALTFCAHFAHRGEELQYSISIKDREKRNKTSVCLINA